MSAAPVPGLVSIMMPAYNAERYVSRAIESVLAQTYTNWELIVVDDGSADRTAEIVEGYDDPRIHLYRQSNGGESVARNTALDHMKGEFLAFLDADDEFLPEHLHTCCAYLFANPDRTGVYTDGYYCDDSGTRLQTLSSRRRGPFEGVLFEELVRASDVFGPPICVVLRRNAIADRELRYDPAIVIGPDWDFFTRASRFVDFGYVDEPTCNYRVHQTNITVQVDSDRRAQYLARCREKAIKLPGFGTCSVATRTAVFYDLLINLLPDQPERKQEVLAWPEYRSLPESEQGRLLRLMASTELQRRSGSAYAGEWLMQARMLNPSDTRSRVLAGCYRLSPGVCAALLRVRSAFFAERTVTGPFGGLT